MAEHITRAPMGSVFPAGTVAQSFVGCSVASAVLLVVVLVVVLHLLSNPSCRREVGALWTDVAVTLVAGIGGLAVEVAGLVARPLPLTGQSVPVLGGVNVLVDTAM